MLPQKTLLAALLTAAVCAAPVQARPLADELQQLLAEHPMLNSGRRSLESTDLSRDAARSAYFPRVSVSADGGQEKLSTQSYSAGQVMPAVPSDLTRRKASLLVEQNLYAGGRTAAAVNMADLEHTTQNNELLGTTQDVLLEGISAYVQVARYNTLITLARRNEETTQRQLGLENTRVERGGGIAVDAMQARVRLQLVKERRVFYEQGLRDAAANYEQVFGHAPDLATMQQLDVATTGIPKTLEEALALGRMRSPQLRAAALATEKARQQIGIEKSAYLPSLDLVATHGNERNANALARRTETAVLLRMNWTLFSGLETKHRVSAASAHHAAMVQREAAVRNKQDEAVRMAWNQLVNGREREELLDSAAQISSDVMGDRKRLRDAGRETVISVLDAEVEYYGVLSNRVNALNDTRLGSYRLLAAVGALTPTELGLQGGSFVLPVKPLAADLGKLNAAP